MDDSERAELESLRAENARLKAENTELHPQIRAQQDQALRSVASHARVESSAYQQIQAHGLSANVHQPSEVAYEAAQFLLDSGF